MGGHVVVPDVFDRLIVTLVRQVDEVCAPMLLVDHFGKSRPLRPGGCCTGRAAGREGRERRLEGVNEEERS